MIDALLHLPTHQASYCKFSDQMHLIHRSSILISCLKFLLDLTGSNQALYIYMNIIIMAFLFRVFQASLSMLSGFFSTRMPNIRSFHNSKPFPSNLLISKRFFTSDKVEAIDPKIYDSFLQSKIWIGNGPKELMEKLKSFLMISNKKDTTAKPRKEIWL